ncbi:MAG TPA: protein arginine kinase [Firmicutes bacterium]|jgi:protein arginine kinase|nr:protein arginine kinase [Bacillota bacterium]
MVDPEKVFTQANSAWLGQGPDSDVVISTRIRLARNLADLPFPSTASSEELGQALTRLRQASEHLPEAKRYQLLEMDRLSSLEQQILIEKHLVSREHTKEPKQRALVLRDDEAVSIMINEEDHERLQVLMPGLNLDKAWELANRLDDSLEQHLEYAFDDKLGFLTSCPTNLGSGLRASVMLHLPALVLLKQASQVFGTLAQFGLVVRGLYGEGTQALGNFFQISNQLTLNHSEEELIQNLQALSGQVIEQERAARGRLYEELGDRLLDMVWRAYGVLTNARLLTSEEAMRLLSDVRLGVNLNLLSQVNLVNLNKLLVITRPGFIQRVAGDALPPMERDQKRAALVREELSGDNNQ